MSEITLSRPHDLSRLYDHVMARENIYITGQAGIGKSHIITELRQKLEGRRICFYYTLRGIRNTALFTALFAEELLRAGQPHQNVHYQLRRFIHDNPVSSLTGWEKLAEWSADLRLVMEQISHDFLFIMEDVDQWEAEEGSEALQSVLNPLGGAKNCQIILSGQDDLSDDHKPLSFHTFPMEALPVRYIWGNPSPEEEQIYTFTKGNTAFLAELYKISLDTGKDPDRAIAIAMNNYHRVFLPFRARFTALQWNLLRAIALEESVPQPHAFEFLVKHRLGAASSVERALRNLTDASLIERAEDGWAIRDVVFLRWIQWLYGKCEMGS